MQLICKTNYNAQVLQWIDFFNSTILPFIAMFFLSFALIYFVQKSRSRVNSNSKRDNKFAIATVALNLIFFILNLPIVIYDLYMVSAGTNHMMDYISSILYFFYYSIGFYTQLVVNSEFRKEFYKMLNLTTIKKVTNHPTRSEAYTNRQVDSN